MKPTPPSREVYVADIPLETTEEDLRKLFSISGKVHAIQMLTDSHGAFYGRAFIRMSTPAEARDAINSLDGARLGNRCIRVSVPQKKTDAAPLPSSPTKKPGRRKPPGGRRK